MLQNWSRDWISDWNISHIHYGAILKKKNIVVHLPSFFGRNINFFRQIWGLSKRFVLCMRVHVCVCLRYCQIFTFFSWSNWCKMASSNYDLHFSEQDVVEYLHMFIGYVYFLSCKTSLYFYFTDEKVRPKECKYLAYSSMSIM